MKNPDLRILALADFRLLPPDVQAAFDRWRSVKARDVIASAVRRRMDTAATYNLSTVQLYLERLEQAEDEQTIFEALYTLAEVVDVHRQQLGTHSQHLVLIMSQYLNPWGVLEFQRDFASPAPSTVAAAEELWRLARAHKISVNVLLLQIQKDDAFAALEGYYAAHPEAYTRSYDDEKARLCWLLEESYNSTISAAKSLDPETIVYADGQWRVKDLIGHIAAWEHAGITSLRAYHDGKTYRVTDSGYASDDAFNQQIFRKYKHVPIDQLYQLYAGIIERFKTAINKTPPEKFEGEMLCPWGAYGTITHLVEELVKHDKEHRNEMLRLAGQSTANGK